MEQSHYRLKERVDQALLLRGQRDFRDSVQYHQFLWEIFSARNLSRSERWKEERVTLKPLPPYPRARPARPA